ncbi:MAG: hypothetical protein LBV71_06335 [Prevotella sp.]|jgi:hypothetical protein|nr:hypothetical protein [Prevotella sp.]
MSDLSAISIMFEEIKQFLKRIEQSFARISNNSTTNNESSIRTSGMADIENHISQSEDRILAKLEQIGQIQTAPRKIRHEIAIDIRSSWVPLVIAGLALFLITSFVLCYKLKQANENLSDNDLKYRYIRMYSGIDSTDVYKLEDIFVYRRNKKVIGQIREDVHNYERSVIEQAQRLERAKLKEKEAERLRMEAEKLKSDK